MVELLKKRDILNRHLLSNSSLYDAINAGVMPPPLKLSSRVCAWPANESDAILRARIAGATKDEIRKLVLDLVAQRKAMTQRVAA